jgi:glutathione S-transferase
MKFYDCSTAPSPRRVRIFLKEKGLELPTVQVNLRGGEHLSDEFKKINPYCTVPALELDDGTRLTNTHGIWRYIEETHPEPSLLGRDAREKALVADWEWRMERDGFDAAGEALRNSAPGLKDRALTGPVDYAQIPALAERGRARSERFLQELDALLANRPFIAGPTYSVADITAFVSVDFIGWIKLKIPDGAKHLRRWYEAVKARPGTVT